MRAGESGKSTFVKQMRTLYGLRSDLSEEDVLQRRAAVFRTVLESMAALLRASEHFVPLANEDLKDAKKAVLEKAGLVLGTEATARLMTADLKDMLVALWNDEGIRETWNEHRSTIQAQESLEHFMNDAERVLHHDFEVKEIDWLRARLRTTGVVTEKFQVQGIPFTVIDVGGQRNERRKWIHVFSNVTSVIYVTAINEYDEVLFEDNETNRVQESLNLFEKMVNHEAFVDSGMILFLNKSDLFKEKLTRVPIRYEDPKNPPNSRWLDYDGPDAVGVFDYDSPEFDDAYKAGCAYFKDKFMRLNQTPSTKGEYT